MEIRAAYDTSNCTRFEILRSRLRDILNNPQHPFWQKDQKDQKGQPSHVYRYVDPLFTTPLQPVRYGVERSVEFWDEQDCRKRAVARIQFGADIQRLLLPQVQAGTVLQAVQALNLQSSKAVVF